MTQFVIEVVVDPRRAVPGARKVRGELERMEGSATRLKRALTGALGILTVGAGITAGTRLLANFSQEMSTVAAIAQTTGQEFDDLQAKAIELGTNTRFTATQAAEGMTFLARAGFEADEVFETVESTLELAQAGALGLGEAADIASNALTAFRLETDQAGRVVDVLALAANSSNTTVRQLGDGLKLVAPIAAGVGVEIEETAAAIAALSNAGLQATLAGTGLRRVISELESPSAKTKRQLGDLGLETKDFRISSVGLTAALQALAEAGVDTGLGLEIFGDRGGPAFEVLSNSIPDVIRFTESLNEADGTASRIAATMDDNLNGAILATKSALEGLVLGVGEAGATGALRGFFDITTVGLRGLANNIDLVTAATLGFGTVFAAVKLAPLASSVVASTVAFVKLRIAVASGTAVILGSAAATQLQAVAEVESAAALVAKTTANIAAIKAETAKAIVVAGSTQTLFIQAAVETQLAAATAANTVATEALTIAQGKLATATAATTIRARALAAINPFAGLIAAGAIAIAGTKLLVDEFDELAEQALRVQEAGDKFALTEFGKVGADIVRVQENLAAVNDQIDKDVASKGFANPVALQAAQRYEQQLETLRFQQGFLADGTAKTTEEAQAQTLALDLLATAVGGVISSIEQENDLLQENSRERQIQAALIQEVTELEKQAGVDVDEGQRGELEAALRRNQLLQDQAAAFESIRGPQEAFNAQVAALTVLEEEGRITTEELSVALLGLAQTAEGLDLSAADAGGGQDIASRILEQVEATKELARIEALRASIIAEAEGPLAALQARQEETIALGKEGAITEEAAALAFEKTAEAIRLLNPEYARQQALIQEIEGPTAALMQRQEDLQALILATGDATGAYALALEEVAAALVPVTEEQALQAEILADIQEPQDALAARLLALDALLQANKISAQEYNRELERMGVASETTNTALSGFQIGLRNSVDEITDVQGAAQNLVENGFSAAEDALVSFVRTGEADFSAFVDGLLDDIARLLVKQALLAAFGGGGGGGAAGAIGSFFTAQGGGRVPGNSDVIVGEDGPELIRTPAGGGDITPAGETAAIMRGAAAAAPIVNVTTPPVNITNVSDPSEIPSGIESPDGEQAVMNVVRKNRRTFQGITA